MRKDLKEQADALLDAALAVAGERDPRQLYRPAMKHLRARDPAGFDRALSHFEEELVPAVAGGADVLAAWREYGLVLARALGPGRTEEVDETGRARPLEAPNPGSGLVLFFPDQAEAPTLALRCPAEPSPAQAATLELLVEGRVSASAYD